MQWNIVPSSRRTILNFILISSWLFCRLVADSYFKKRCNTVRYTLENILLCIDYSYRVVGPIVISPQITNIYLPWISQALQLGWIWFPTSHACPRHYEGLGVTGTLSMSFCYCCWFSRVLYCFYEKIGQFKSLNINKIVFNQLVLYNKGLRPSPWWFNFFNNGLWSKIDRLTFGAKNNKLYAYYSCILI